MRVTHRVLACSAGWVSGILRNHKHPPEACAGLPVAEEVAALEFYLFTLPTSFLPLEMAPGGRSSWTRK